MESQILMTIIIIAVIYSLLTFAADYMCFRKAGVQGWKAFIPVYNKYIYAMIASGDSEFSSVYTAATVAYAVLNIMNRGLKDLPYILWLLLLFCAIVVGIVSLISSIWVNYRFAKAFSGSDGFAVAKVLFPLICSFIIVFDPNKVYCGSYRD